MLDNPAQKLKIKFFFSDWKFPKITFFQEVWLRHFRFGNIHTGSMKLLRHNFSSCTVFSYLIALLYIFAKRLIESWKAYSNKINNELYRLIKLTNIYWTRQTFLLQMIFIISFSPSLEWFTESLERRNFASNTKIPCKIFMNY